MTLSRRERLILLVRWYPEAIGLGESGPGGDASDDRVLLQGELWQAAPHIWKELERCIAELKRIAPRRYEHLRARYWLNEPKRVAVTRSVKSKSGRSQMHVIKDGEKQYELRDSWPKWVDVCHMPCHEQKHCCKVNSGLLILDRLFKGDPSLPKTKGIVTAWGKAA